MTIQEEHEAKVAWINDPNNNKYDYAAYKKFCEDNNFELMSFNVYSLTIDPPKMPTVFTKDQPSRGLGDTVAKITHATGLDKLADIYTGLTGKPCGCASRQEALNKLVPYGVVESDE